MMEPPTITVHAEMDFSSPDDAAPSLIGAGSAHHQDSGSSGLEDTSQGRDAILEQPTSSTSMDPTAHTLHSNRDPIHGDGVVLVTHETITSMVRVETKLARVLAVEFPWMAKAALDQILASVNHGIAKQQAEMTAAKSRISFLDFSPEVRNTIYEMAFADLYRSKGDRWGQMVIQDMKLVESDDDYQVTTFKPIHGAHMRVPSLLQTSKQVRAETIPFWYGSATFLARIDEDKKDRACAWLEHLGPEKCAMIKTFIIDLRREYLKDVLKLPGRLVEEKQPILIHGNFWGERREDLQTTVSYIVIYLDMAKYGVPASSFKVQCESDLWGDEPDEKVSDTAMWCPTCEKSDEMESAWFKGGECNYCYDMAKKVCRTEEDRERWLVEHGEDSDSDSEGSM